MRPSSALALVCLLAVLAGFGLPEAQARTVYRCVRDGTVSLATAPEPGSRCEARQIEDDAVQLPNLWGRMGVFSGTLRFGNWTAVAEPVGPDGGLQRHPLRAGAGRAAGL